MATFPSPPEFWAEDRAPELWRLMSQAVRGLLRGKSNNSQIVTLRANETTTAVVSEHITADTVALLSPRTAFAGAAMTSTYTVATLGKVTIHHVSSVSTDRTFGIVFIG